MSSASAISTSTCSFRVPVIPGFDQKVGGRHLGQMPGGMSANSAVAFTRLGRPARLMAAIGDDAGGGEALMKVAAEGVDVSHVVCRSGVNSFMCVVLLSPSGEKSLIRLETDAYMPRVADIVPAVFDGIRHVHVTYGDADLTGHVLRQARDRGLTASLDLEPPDIHRAPARLARCWNWSIPSSSTAKPGCPPPRRSALPLAPAMLKRRRRDRRDDGRRRLPPHRRRRPDRRCPAWRWTPIDTTGAGDCFAAAYITAKLEGASLPDRLRFANAAAALATLAYGAQSAMPRRGDVEELLKSLAADPELEGQTHA